MNTVFNRRHLLAGAGAGIAVSAFTSKVFAQNAQLPPRPTPDQWAKAPAMGHIALSPDGNHIAYVVVQDDGTQLLYHYNRLSKAFQTFNLGSLPLGFVSWLDGDHIAISMHKAVRNSSYMGLRNKRFGMKIYNLAKGTSVEPSELLGPWAGTLTRINHDGRTCYLTSAYLDERTVLARFELDKSTYDIVDTGGYEVENWVLTPEGELIGRSEYYTDKKTWTLSYRNGNSWKEIYTHKGELDQPSLLGLGRDGKSLLVLLQNGDQADQYFEVDGNGKFSAPIDTPGISHSALFDPLTFRLCGFATFDSWFSYHYFDPVKQDLVTKAEKAVAGYRMSIAEQADDPRTMIVYTEGDDDAGTYYLINFATGETMTLGELYPQIPVEWISSKKAITYKAADGLEIEAFLTLPPNREPKNLPLVMLPHGGPATRDDLSYDREVQAYAAEGYAVLQPNFRGSTGYGEPFERAGDGEVGRKMQTDLSDGVRHLVAQGLVDPKRVCIIGTSYGGYAAYAGAAIDTGIYNCAVAIAGLADAVKWLEAERGYQSIVTSPAYTYTKRLLGNENTLLEISPIAHIDRITIPVLIMHGLDDSVVPITQSREMYKAMKAANKDVTYIEVQNSEHGATTQASRTQIMTATLKFLQQHNPPA